MPGSRRKYGYFRCTDCGKRWESSHVYCKDGTSSEFYKQDCKDCKTACTPYRLENIRCSQCGETLCVCSKEMKENRHTDPNKPHRSDLCHKCRSGRPCMGY